MTERAVVTGGTGFLGRRLVELLLARGDDVGVLARTSTDLPARSIVGDVRDPDALDRALRGADVVYHVAAKVGHWGPRREFESVNVEGTRQVLAAARRAGVGRLVFTSSPSVVGYGKDFAGVESAPYPARWEYPYGETKARAEQLVLAANGPDLLTVALRPHAVIGPGDPNLLPRLVAKARAGRAWIIGRGDNRVDLTSVDNAAWAHLDAATALAAHRGGGRAYFVTNGEPVLLWPWLQALLQRLGAPPIRRRLGRRTAEALALALELAHEVLGLQREPPLTRFLAAALSRSHWYSIEPARRELGYEVRVSLAETVDQIVAAAA